MSYTVYVLRLDVLGELLVNVYEVIIIPPPLLSQEYKHYLYLTVVNYFSMQAIISEMCVIAPAVSIF